MSERIDDLKILVERAHGCRATHAGSETIHEQFEGMPVWDGVVETFQLEGHPKAKRAYAWVVPAKNPEKREYKIVLGVPPVNSPHDAVRAEITRYFKQVVEMARQVIDQEKR